jgi:hypothetical protein
MLDEGVYVREMARRSEGPFRYVTRYAPFSGCPVSNCNKQFYAGKAQVGVLNELKQGAPTRVLDHGRRPRTELWGTAPLRLRGDGVMLHIDQSNALMRQPGFHQECARPLSEQPYNRYDYITFPNAAETWRRGGESTRLGPVYVQPVPI